MNLIEHFERKKKFNNEYVSKSTLSYVFQKIEPEVLLSSLGIRFLKKRYKNYIIGWCPDHYFYTKRMPSHPKWYLNINTGTTICYTEGRTSNILEIIKFILKIQSNQEAMDYIIGNKNIVIPSGFELNLIYQKQTRKQDEERKVKLKKTLDSLRIFLDENRQLSQEAINFFAKNGIREDTLKKFNVFEVDMSGFRDRVVIPFFNYNNELIGYGSVSILKRKEWTRKRIINFKFNNYLELIKKYREIYDNFKKVIFCPNSNLAEDLFGINNLDLKNLKEVVLVEGERDVMKLQQEGFNALGTHGNHLTLEQAELLKKLGVQELILAYDPDKAGKMCADKILSEYSNMFNSIIRLDLDDRDPKDYDKESFIKLIDVAKREKQINYWRSKINAKCRISQKFISKDVSF